MLALNDIILKTTSANAITGTELVQKLWSGYGQLKRYHLKGGKYASVIAKHIQLPEAVEHPRGWNTALSHQRKVKSYRVERAWYQYYADNTDTYCRVPKCYHVFEQNSQLLIIMEDLDASGFYKRSNPDTVTLTDAKNCLSWLAHLHAKFMGAEPNELWSIGTYWHLATRPDEWSRMENTELKKVAKAIDEKLNQAKYQTFVHGDAKLANFCFNESGGVAAVDFQYVGKGCGIKDVAYLISSCFDELHCEMYEKVLLEHYFDQLALAIGKNNLFQNVKKEWSNLYKYAWSDFYRFLDGWNPGHWKMHNYSLKLTQQVINELNT